MTFRFLFIALIAIFASLSGCGPRTPKSTTIEVPDSQRHYYPITQGRELKLIFDIKNTGNHAFELQDILLSCGCIVPNIATVKTIPANSTGKLVLMYDTTKNIGYVEHFITLYGNTHDQLPIELKFDVNVVPDAHYTKDYEELFEEYKDSNVKNAVDGKNDRFYYVDEN